jgi:ribonuclease HI
MEFETEVIIYTDGGCEPNPGGPGGWGAILLFENSTGTHERVISGGDTSTTNNRMEMMAVISSLEVLKRPCDVIIHSDSQYVVKGTGNWNEGQAIHPTGWMVNWKKKGWRKSDGPIKNPDLWERIDKLVRQQNSVQMKWVKGHAGHEYNERCDQLALEERLKQ